MSKCALALMVQPMTAFEARECVLAEDRPVDESGYIWEGAIKWRMTGSNYSNALLCSVAG